VHAFLVLQPVEARQSSTVAGAQPYLGSANEQSPRSAQPVEARQAASSGISHPAVAFRTHLPFSLHHEEARQSASLTAAHFPFTTWQLPWSVQPWVDAQCPSMRGTHAPPSAKHAPLAAHLGVTRHSASEVATHDPPRA
jgi:hypothetical protein